MTFCNKCQSKNIQFRGDEDNLIIRMNFGTTQKPAEILSVTPSDYDLCDDCLIKLQDKVIEAIQLAFEKFGITIAVGKI